MTRPLLLIIALSTALAGCGDKDDDGTDGTVDADGDGFAEDDDCDDDDDTVNPDATEVCDGIDNDCDGEADEDDADDATTWFTDSDGDGYGVVGTDIVACAAPSGTVDNDLDCDDDDGAVHPDADELCSTAGVDDDCDGDIDEDDAADADEYFSDQDADGYGDISSRYTACIARDVLDVGNSDDCDDGDVEVNPDAIEVCDGVDNDCDDDVDEDDAADAATWYGDTDGDGFGDIADPRNACLEPSGYVADNTDCDDDNIAINPGADELCSTTGVDDNCDGTADEDTAADAGTWYADTDGDGYGDASSSSAACIEPSGAVADDTDCDDTSSLSYPGADELCDGVDNDCDSTTSEAGVATFFDTSGAPTDYSSTLTGTSSAPASATLATAGELSICEGTWYVNLDVEADLDIYAQSGDPTTTILDGAAGGSVIDIATDSIIVELWDLTIQNGSGDGLATNYASTAGGGVACESTVGDTELSLDGVILSANDAETGGGLASDGCIVDMLDTTVDVNTATLSGGLHVQDADLTMTTSTVSDNIASEYVGAIYLLGATVTVNAYLEDVDITGNEATDGVGAVGVAGPADFVMLGTASGASSVTDNLDAAALGAGIATVGGSTFDATLVSFGTSAGGDDNDGYDIYLWDSAFAYFYDDDESVSCTAEVCGTETTTTIATSANNSTSDGSVRGNVFLAESNGTIDSFEFYGSSNGGGSCSLEFQVLSAAATTDTAWTLEWSDTVTVATSTDAWISSGDVGVPVEVGVYYALAVAYDCSASGDDFSYHWSTAGSSTADMGMGTSVARWAEFTSSYTSPSGGVSDSYYSAADTRYYSRVSWSH